MPKMKSHSGAKKRFHRTGNGKWKFKQAAQRHLLTPSSSKRGRLNRKADYLNNTDGKTIEKYLPYN